MAAVVVVINPQWFSSTPCPNCEGPARRDISDTHSECLYCGAVIEEINHKGAVIKMEKPIKNNAGANVDTFMSAKVDTCADVRVYGRTRSSVIQQALMTAQDRGFGPDYVTAWVDWWDKAAAVEREKAAAEQAEQAVQAVPDTEAMKIARRAVAAMAQQVEREFITLGGRKMFDDSEVPRLIRSAFEALTMPVALAGIIHPDVIHNAE